MKKKILELLASIQGLQILEATRDIYWPQCEDRIGDVVSVIYISHATSRSVKSANVLISESLNKLKELEGTQPWSAWREKSPKWKDNNLHLGALKVTSVIGTTRWDTVVFTADPEIENLKSAVGDNDMYSFSNGRTGWRSEMNLTRVIIIVVCPDPAVHRAKKIAHLYHRKDFEKLVISKQDLAAIQS